MLVPLCVGGTECLRVGGWIVRVGGCPWLSGRALAAQVSWVQFLAAAGFFIFLYLRLITSKFIYFQHEALSIYKSVGHFFLLHWCCLGNRFSLN